MPQFTFEYYFTRDVVGAEEGEVLVEDFYSDSQSSSVAWSEFLRELEAKFDVHPSEVVHQLTVLWGQGEVACV